MHEYMVTWTIGTTQKKVIYDDIHKAMRLVKTLKHDIEMFNRPIWNIVTYVREVSDWEKSNIDE